MAGNNPDGLPGFARSGNGHPPMSDAANASYHRMLQTQTPTPLPPMRKVSSPEHYRPPHESPDPPPNRFAYFQESALIKNDEAERADRAKIEEWESTKRCWSGTGQKHVESKELEFPVESVDGTMRLGSGAYGVVDRVTYNGVMMARKKIDRHNLRHPQTLDELREEAKFMERLTHRHIVTLIGTYTLDNNRFLNMLTYPVAVCDLEQFLWDFEQIRSQKFEHILDISDRIQRLGFADIPPIQYSDKEIRREVLTTMSIRMIEMLGCVTDAMEYVHSENIRHQDLKPRNVLLSPGKAYITDFGISRVLRQPVPTIVNDTTVGYAPPEVLFEDEVHHPSAVDVYSLGCIFLNVVAMPPGYPRTKIKEVLSSKQESREEEIAVICDEIAVRLMSFGQENEANHTISQKHIMGLIKWMLLNEPDERPDMRTVNSQLHMLGGLDQIYHASCCKRPTAWMAASLNENIRTWEAQSEKRYDEARVRFNRSLEDKQKAVVEKERVQEENEMLKEEIERLREALSGPYDMGSRQGFGPIVSSDEEETPRAIEGMDFEGLN